MFGRLYRLLLHCRQADTHFSTVHFELSVMCCALAKNAVSAPSLYSHLCFSLYFSLSLSIPLLWPLSLYPPPHPIRLHQSTRCHLALCLQCAAYHWRRLARPPSFHFGWFNLCACCTCWQVCDYSYYSGPRRLEKLPNAIKTAHFSPGGYSVLDFRLIAFQANSPFDRVSLVTQKFLTSGGDCMCQSRFG